MFTVKIQEKNLCRTNFLQDMKNILIYIAIVYTT